MRYLSLFDDFSQIDESYSFDSDSLFEAKMNQMTDLKENCMASWDFEDFKNFFNPYVNESVSDEDRGILMEKAYYTYELGVLYEHNKEWFSGSDNIYYLEDNSNDVPRAILFKNNRLHIISGESLSKLKEGLDLILNEGWLSDIGSFLGKAKDKAVGAFNKYVKEPVKKAAAWVGDKAKKVWNAVSSGAKAVWEFAKKIASAVAAFVKEDPMNAIAIGLMIISGIISFIPAAGQVVGPVLMVIAGVIQLYTGGRDLVKASKEVGTAEKVSDIVKGGTKIVFGSASLLLGIKDIVASAAAALPGMGATGVAVKASVTTWATNFGKTAFGAPASKGVGAALGCSAWIAEFFSTLCLNAPFMKKFIEVAADGTKAIKPQWLKAGTQGANAALGKGVDVVTAKEKKGSKKQNASLDLSYSAGSLNEAEGDSWGFGELIINFLAYIGRACFSWLYKAITGALSGIGKLINGIMDLPSRITKGIDSFKEKYKSSFIGGILSGGLSTFVRPFSNVASKVIDGYIKPIVKPITGWMVGLGKKDAAIAAKIKASPILSKPPVPGVKDPGKVTIPAKKVEITAKDKAAIKKIGNKGVSTMVKAGGGTQKMVEKIKKAQDEFKKKFPGVSKEKGSWGSSPSGKATYTIKSKEAGGSVTLFNDGKYTVASGPNKKARGEFKAQKGVKLIEPKDGWKNNESRNYILSIDSFLG